MISILFWNVDKKPHVLSHLACFGPGLPAPINVPIDVFLLAECPKNLNPTLLALNGLGRGTYREAVASKAKVRALTRLGPNDFAHVFTGLGRELGVWSLRAAKLQPAEILLAGVHLLSKAGGNRDTDQASVAKEVVEELVEFEDLKGHRNTFIVGDFNMHPYDPAMTSVTGVHGLMTRALAEQPDRVHRRRPRRRFYNPMWGMFGDRTPGPAGSYYWRSSVLHNPHWGMLDQLLMRVNVADRLASLSILDYDGTHQLVAADGAPDREYLSDHLPILFQLDL